MSRAIKLTGCILVCHAAGIIGAVFTHDAVATWYPTLVKPAFNPPAGVFGPVWLALYTLMGVSLYAAGNTRLASAPARQAAMIFFFVQLMFNALWSVVFFGLRSIAGGMAVIVVLWLAIVVTVRWFFNISRVAGWLLVPYLAWVSFAMVLNIAYYQLNR